MSEYRPSRLLFVHVGENSCVEFCRCETIVFFASHLEIGGVGLGI